MCWQRGAALRQKGETGRGEHNHNLTNIKLYHLTYVVAFYFLQRALRQKGEEAGGHNHTNTKLLVYFWKYDAFRQKGKAQSQSHIVNLKIYYQNYVIAFYQTFAFCKEP